MLKLLVVSDIHDFEALGEVWNKILQKSLDNDIFSTWEWIWCWWKHFGKSRRLRLLIAQNNGEIVGIAPFMISTYSLWHVGKLSKVEFIGSPHADYNNFILIKKGLDCLRLFINNLLKFSDWDLLDLRDIRGGSKSADFLRIICNEQNPKLRFFVGTLCPYIKLPNSFEVFMNSLSRNMRRNLRKRMKKICKEHKVKFITHRAFDSIKEAFETFCTLHQKRWRSKGKRGSTVCTSFKKFHIDVANLFDKKGWLDLQFLTVDDEPVAAAYTFNYNLKKYGYQTGFDPEFSRYGVGNLLKMHLVEECIRKGYREYDLTRGFEPYKANWATNVRKNFFLWFIRRGLFARMYCRVFENSFSRFLSSKFGAHLMIRNN